MGIICDCCITQPEIKVGIMKTHYVNFLTGGHKDHGCQQQTPVHNDGYEINMLYNSGEQQEKRTTCGHVNQTPLTWFLDYNWASETSNCKSNRCKNFNWVKILNWIHFKTRCDCYLELIRNLPIACLKAAELCNFNFLRK